MPLPTNTGQNTGQLGLPSTGIGNIPPATGAPNAPAAGTGMPVRPMPNAAGLPAANRPPIPPAGGSPGNLSQIMSQLHPATTQALKSIPPQALQQLHQAGLIHPGLMQHLTGN